MYTDFVTVEVYGVDAGPDQTVCLGEQNQIIAGSNYPDAQYSWSPATDLSCTECSNPVFTANTIGTQQYVVTLTTPFCTYTDTMIVEVVQGDAPIYTINQNQHFCEFADIELGGTDNPGVEYLWTTTGGYLSNEPSPSIQIDTTTTFYLEISNASCQFSSF